MYPVLLSGYSRKYCPNNPEYAAYGMSESKVKSMLLRVRNKLKLHLEKEGIVK
jgi:hypothetical protein